MSGASDSFVIPLMINVVFVQIYHFIIFQNVNSNSYSLCLPIDIWWNKPTFHIYATSHMCLILFWNVTWTMYPAIFGGHAPINAQKVTRYWLSKILTHHTNHWPKQEDSETCLVIQFEYPIVYVNFFKFKILDNVSNQFRHVAAIMPPVFNNQSNYWLGK